MGLTKKLMMKFCPAIAWALVVVAVPGVSAGGIWPAPATMDCDQTGTGTRLGPTFKFETGIHPTPPLRIVVLRGVGDVNKERTVGPLGSVSQRGV